MSRTCHFHDGCAWPSEYGGPHCDCRRLGLSDFRKDRSTSPRYDNRILLRYAVAFAVVVIIFILALGMA